VRTCVARIAREKVGIEPIRNHGGGGDNTMYMIASAHVAVLEEEGGEARGCLVRV